MLYMTINQDCPSMKMTIFEILEIVGMDIRRLELDDALKIPIQVSKKLYKEKIPTTDLRTHLLSANQGTTFDGHTATMADILSCCAMVTVYDPDPASTTYKQVWVYHAFGGIINDGTMIFNI
ncbi:MAG: hypothetical protein LUG14_12135 [Synergistaceae bacterium]|nr:hypothetical protein [Synergistaceae bacterium]